MLRWSGVSNVICTMPIEKEVIKVVIQLNMSPKAIIEVWGNTVDVFKKHNIPLAEKNLETLVEADALTPLLQELNAIVGSSTATCIEGG